MTAPRKPADTKIRERLVRARGVNVTVDASAGTGKTHLMMDRLLFLLEEEHVPLPRIAAITFTKKAAGELVTRLRERIEKAERADGADRALLRRALQDLEQASVATIHSFCAGLLSEYPVEAGVDPRLSVLEEDQARAFESECWDGFLRALKAEAARPLLDALHAGLTLTHVQELKRSLLSFRSLLSRPEAGPLPAPEGVRSALDAAAKVFGRERSHCTDEEDALFVIVEGVGAWRERLAGLKGTEQALAAARQGEPKFNRKGSEKNWGGKARITAVREAVADVADAWREYQTLFGEVLLRNLTGFLWDYLDQYAARKSEAGFLDFNDQLLKTRDLLLHHPEVREALKRRYDHLLVDEFQDTDPLQVQIVFLLCEERGRSAGRFEDVVLEKGKLFLVGDPKQSIYRFRGADVEMYEDARRRVAAQGGLNETLGVCFRMRPALVAFSNRFLAPLFEGSGDYVPQTAHRGEPEDPRAIPPLWVLSVSMPEGKVSADERRLLEAKAVASFLKRGLLAGAHTVPDRDGKGNHLLGPGDVAVLFKELSTYEDVYEKAFREAGLPYAVVGGRRFYNRMEVANLTAILLALRSPADEAAVAACLRGPAYGFSDEDLLSFRLAGGRFLYLEDPPELADPDGRFKAAFRQLGALHEAARTLSTPDILLRILLDTALMAVTAAQHYGEQRVANLLKVVDQSRDLERSGGNSFRNFVEWLQARREEAAREGEAPGPDQAGDRVTLMTVHQAKGLEFPVVVVAGGGDWDKDESFLPDRSSGRLETKLGGYRTSGMEEAMGREAARQQAETQRLLYVACTRPRESLVIPLLPDTGEKKFLAPFLGALTKDEGTHDLAPGLQGHFIAFSDEPGKRADLAAFQVLLANAKADPKAVRSLADALDKSAEERRNRIRELHDAGRRVTAHRVAEEEGENASASSEAMAFGSTVHRLMAGGVGARKEPSAATIRSVGLASGLSKTAVSEAQGLIARAFASPLILRAMASKEVHVELPVSLVDAAGEMLEGVMDLAFVEDGKWVVVDYKTDRDPARFKEKYEAQLKAYARLLEASTKMPVKEKVLLFLRSGEEARV